MIRIAAAAALLALSPNPPRQDAPHVYRERELRGWNVRFERALDGTELGGAAWELLDHQLYAIERAVPAAALAKLRAVPIWLSKDDPVAPCMCYHPSAEWLSSNGHDPRKARGVEIANAERFLEWVRQQPSMVLHELAHAYHHQVLGYDHAGLRAAFERAGASGAYDSVLHWDGVKQRHYALNNDTEFFSELSEAWFGTNDFYPFVRAEVLASDPQSAALLRELWGG